MTRSVLIADDDVKLLQMLQFIVEGHGCEVILCQNGYEVLKSLKYNSVDLLLLDILMPRMNGYETVKQIRSQKPFKSIPVVFMTGVYDLSQIRKSLREQISASNVLFKPISISRVNKLIMNYLGGTNRIYYVFPSQMTTKPSFKSRIKLTESSESEDNELKGMHFYTPRESDFNSVRPSQVLHYMLNTGGKWKLCFELDSKPAGIKSENDMFTGFWSEIPISDPQLSWRDKLPFFNLKLKKADDINPHPWVSGQKAPPFKRFLYRVITSKSGSYSLSRDKSVPDNVLTIESVNISECLQQILDGPYSQATVREFLPSQNATVSLTNHFLIQPPKIHFSEKYITLISTIKNHSKLADVFAYSSIPREEILQMVLGLYLVGGLEITFQKSAFETDITVEPAKLLTKMAKDEEADKKKDESKPKSDLSSIVNQLFMFGLKGYYYKLLEVEKDIAQEELDSVLRKAQNKFTKSSVMAKLSSDDQQKYQLLYLFLKEAHSILKNPTTRKKYDEILSEYREDVKKTMAENQRDVGIMCIANEKYYKAIVAYKLSLLLDPGQEKIYVALLDLLAEMPEYEPVTSHFCREALKLFPGNMSIRFALAKCYHDTNQKDKAIMTLKQILINDPENVQAMQLLLEYPDQEKEIFGL
ncbi:response regulator [bacterium]|nr:response regulator [candidate division CSSED10-310 bacterium]